jgi:hypothetical protein
LPLVVLATACDDGSQRAAPGRSADPMIEGGSVKPAAKGPPPDVTATITKVSKPDWYNTQQMFVLSVTNHGKKAETVHAIVFATNEDIKPPRRAISPPTAFEWFALAGSDDGRLTVKDIQRCWSNSFVSARGVKKPKSLEVTVEPGATKKIDADHSLEERSQFPATSGKRLAKFGFTQYHVWLFTPDGALIEAKTQSATEVNKPLVKDPTPKPTPPTDKDSPEELANKLLREARTALDAKKPAEARKKLQAILDTYPNTGAARTAKNLLRDISKGS